MSGRPVRITPITPSTRWPAAISERGGDREDEPEDRERVGGDPDAVQAAADRSEPSLDLGAPASVEHRS